MKTMLKVLAVAFSVSVLALGAFAQNKDVSGRWTTSLERGGKSFTFKMDLKVSDNTVAGTMDATPDRRVEIQNGKLEGNQLTFDVTAPEHGHSKTIHFIGDVGDNTITLRNQSGGKQGRTMIYQRSKE